MYGEGACSDLSTVLQSLFCDPVEPLEATDIPRYAMINVMICSQMCELYVSLPFILGFTAFIENFLSCSLFIKLQLCFTKLLALCLFTLQLCNKIVAKVVQIFLPYILHCLRATR